MNYIRIVAMFFIVVSHLVNHGLIKALFSDYQMFFNNDISFKSIVFRSLGMLGGCGNFIFFMIPGYFLSDIVQFKISSIKKIFYTIIPYVIIFTVLSFIFRKMDLNSIGFNKIQAIKELFLPISSAQWWFITAYSILLFIIPGINCLTKDLNRKAYIFIFVYAILFEYILASKIRTDVLFPYRYALTGYLSGKYIKMVFPDKSNVTLNIFSIIFISLLIYMYKYYNVLICLNDSYYFLTFLKNAKINLAIHCLLEIGLSMNLFCLFKNLNDFYSPAINKIAGTTVGIYLIHDSNFIRALVWDNFLNLRNSFNKPYFYLEAFAVCSLIFIICSMFDMLRQYISSIISNSLITDKIIKKIKHIFCD